MNLLKPLIFTLVLAFALTPLLIIFSKRKKILYFPTTTTMHKKPVPILGGVAIWMVFSLGLFIFYRTQSDFWPIFWAGALVFSVGLVDDVKKGISSYFRLFIQILAGFIAVSAGIVFTFLPNVAWGKVGEYILSVIWMVGICNTYNMLDGLDGLAIGSGVINAFFFLVISQISQQAPLAVMAVVMVGTALGFLFYNFSPAKIFLGSSGSTFLGFMLSLIAIKGNWAENNVIALIVPLLILGIPIFDMVATTILRVKNGQVRSIKEWFDYKGRDHFHYKLFNISASVAAPVLFIYALTVCLGISAVILFTSGSMDAFLLIIQAVFILSALFLFAGLQKPAKSS